MSVLTVQNLTFGFSDGVLFEGAAFQVNECDRIGLIGANGSGKTSLFKLITGEYVPETGGIVRGKDVRLGYMEQYLECDETLSVYDETLKVYADVSRMEEELDEINHRLLSGADTNLIERQAHLQEEIERRGGLIYRAFTKSALCGLGFAEKELSMPISSLSGGQRAKLSLCKLLLSDANLLLLDEPTNNLDIEAITWLEDFLGKFKGALIVVSHDRYFLDKITNETMEIEYHRVAMTVGNYSVFHALKAKRELTEEREYKKKSAEIERLEGVIAQQRTFGRERNFVTIDSKQKQIDRLQSDLVKPESEKEKVHFSFTTDMESGEEILTVSGLSKAFPEKKLFSSFDLELRKGDRLFLLGPNGCGKSTFLKILNKELYADAGSFRYGVNVRAGYFDQNIERLHSEKTVLDEIWDRFYTLSQTEIRSALAQFLFKSDDVYKKVSILSGGERAKLTLLKLMLQKPNLLILDEPTNHLDIASREVLENSLLDYNGTLLVVSHDRYFINKLATRIVYLSPTGAVQIEGNYDDYLALLSRPAATESPKSVTVKESDYRRQKALESAQRKKQTRIQKVEEQITRSEKAIKVLEAELSRPETAADYEKLLSVTDELNAQKESLDSLYAEWECLSS